MQSANHRKFANPTSSPLYINSMYTVSSVQIKGYIDYFSLLSSLRCMYIWYIYIYICIRINIYIVNNVCVTISSSNSWITSTISTKKKSLTPFRQKKQKTTKTTPQKLPTSPPFSPRNAQKTAHLVFGRGDPGYLQLVAIAQHISHDGRGLDLYRT